MPTACNVDEMYLTIGSGSGTQGYEIWLHIRFKDYCQTSGSFNLADCQEDHTAPCAWDTPTQDSLCENDPSELFWSAHMFAGANFDTYSDETCCNLSDKTTPYKFQGLHGMDLVYDANGDCQKHSAGPWGLRRQCRWGSGAYVKITSLDD